MYKRFFCLTFLGVFTLLLLYSCKSPHWGKSIVQPCTIPLDSNSIHLISSDEYLWDTGCVYSLLLDADSLDTTFRTVSHRLLSDANGRLKRGKLYMHDQVKVGALEIDHAVFAHLPLKAIPEQVVHQYFPKGIIGMNIISSANWFFNLDQNSLSVYPPDSIPSFLKEQKTIELHYSNPKQPTVKLSIHGKEFKVMIDTGSNTYLSLTAKNIRRLNKVLTPSKIESEELMSLFDKRKPTQVYYYDEAQINHLKVYPLIVLESKFNHLGMGFFHQFQSFFIDTQNQVIYLFPKSILTLPAD